MLLFWCSEASAELQLRSVSVTINEAKEHCCGGKTQRLEEMMGERVWLVVNH